MASQTWGSHSSHFMIIPNTKRLPNNTKTDQLPILMSLPAFQGRTFTLFLLRLKFDRSQSFLILSFLRTASPHLTLMLHRPAASEEYC